MKQVSVKMVWAYFGTLLAVTIPFWVLGSVTRIHGLPFNMQLNVLLVLAMPLVSAVFIARTYGAASLRRVLLDLLPGRRTNGPSVAMAFFVVPATATAVFVMSRFFAAFDGWLVPLYLAPVYFAVYYVAAALEEIGWTWFATPILGSKMSVASAGLVIGLIWAMVHTLPWYQQSGLWFMAGMVAFSVVNRVIMTWLYLKNGGLLWLNIVYHAMINTTFTVFHSGSPYANPLVYAAVLAPVALAIWGKRGSRLK